ncbi:MAG: glycosyltransferase family 2 protein [Parvularculaceae bacterium]|nr:glycosyltransferase family 2 protein [Parvularculaceae bacterium]
MINGDMIDGVTANDDLNEGAGRCGARARISAIVVSYFTGPVLGRCLDALRRQDGVCEVILVDNGNPDGVVKAAIGDTGAPTPVKLVSGHGNVGFATACNLGARAASGDVLLFVNPDAVMPPGGAARLAADGAAKGGAWLIGAKIVDPDGAEQRGSRRATLTPWRAFVEATKLYRFAPKHPYFRRFNLHGDPCPDDVIALPVISGACFMTPKNDYFALGGMDERYFLHVEDVDFCLRFRAAGGRVFFDPHVSVLHYKSSSRVDPLFVEMRKTASMLRYFRTHFSEVYPAPFMWMVAAVAWMQFGVLAAFKILRRIFVPWRVFVRRARASVTRR